MIYRNVGVTHTACVPNTSSDVNSEQSSSKFIQTVAHDLVHLFFRIPSGSASKDECDKGTIKDDRLGSSGYKTKIVWSNVLLYAYFHVLSLYGVYLCFTSAMWKTMIFSYIYYLLGNCGITAGAHRLWSHKSYKAKWPLRVLLCAFMSIAGQNDIFEWCRDHRVHHKFSETNADPHSIKRGFFFAHMGWLLCKKHPDVLRKGKTLQMDDLLADPIVRFHRRNYWIMMPFFCICLPTLIPVFCWGETWMNAFYVAGLLRYCLSLHFTWLVNSAAHFYGNQPFDKYNDARENPLVSLFTVGEGWHNFHHVFPWDYSASELGYTLNLTKLFIDFMACIGLAYDLKTASPKVVKSQKEKNGDGTRLYFRGNE